MTKQEAVELLQIHSGKHPNKRHFKLQTGLVGMLKHFSGELDENQFLDVLRAIQCLSSDFQQDNIQTEFLSYVMEIYCFIKYEVLKNERLARQFSPSQKETLMKWNHTIFSGITNLVQGMPFHEAFSGYGHLTLSGKRNSIGKRNHQSDNLI